MHDPIDWTLTTWEGNRRRQHQEFQALTFRQKMEALEGMAELSEMFAARARLREASASSGDGQT